MAAGAGTDRRLVLLAWGAFCAGPALAYLQLVPAMGGFALFALGGLLGLVACVAGVVAVARGRAPAAGLVAPALLVVAFVALAAPGRRYPRINDITTDPQQPPQFVHAQTLPANQGRELTYPGPAFADQQTAAYPDLAPLIVGLSPDEAFTRVEAAARVMPAWEITRVDPGARALEGVATSRVFRFQDDFVVEVRPRDGGSVVHMRSKSRDGQGDLGANAQRINDFFAHLRWTRPPADK